MRGPSLLVVGAGINGLWTAWRFLRAGWEVTLADAGPLPNPAAASWDQHRLIHPLGAESEADVHAIERALGGWAELWSRLGHSHYRQTGGLLGNRIEARSIFLGAAGWPCQRVGSASLAALVPGLRRHPESGGLWTPRAGVLLADRIVTDMVRLIDGLGCRLLPHRPILEEEIREGRFRLGHGERFEPDLTIIAAGAGTGEMLRILAPRLAGVDQTMFYFSAPRAWERAPLLVDFGPHDDLWAAPPVAGTMLKLAASNLAVPGGVFDIDALSERITETFRTIEWRFVRQARCRYARTADGARILEPVKGTDQRVWVVAGCNGGGFKLAPLVADLVWQHARGQVEALA